MARPGWAWWLLESLGVLGRGKRGRRAALLLPWEVGGGLEIRVEGEEKDLFEMFRVFCLFAGPSHSPAPEAGGTPGRRGTPAPPVAVLVLGAAGTISLPGCSCSLSQERHCQPGNCSGRLRLEPGAGWGGRCAVIPPVQTAPVVTVPMGSLPAHCAAPTPS